MRSLSLTFKGTNIYWFNYVFLYRLQPDCPETRLLQSINQRFLEEAPNGLPSDIAPWLGIVYRNREKRMEKVCKDFLVTLDKLYRKAKEDYVPGENTYLKCFKWWSLAHTRTVTHAQLSLPNVVVFLGQIGTLIILIQ